MDKGSVYGNLTNARRLNSVNADSGEKGSVYGNHANARRWGAAQSGNTGSVYGNLINAQRLVSINASAFVSNESLLNRMGGDAMVNSLVRYFYAKALRDKRIRGFFDFHDVKDMEKRIQGQISFLRAALTGQKNSEFGNGISHMATLGLSDSHFDAVIENLVVTLREQNVPHQLIGEMAAFVDSVRQEVLG